MVKFAHRTAAADSAALTELFDIGIVRDRARQPNRNYLGGSRLGEACDRMLSYEYTHTPKDPGRDFNGQTLRIFDRGNAGEERMKNYLRMAGFQLITEGANGKQIGIWIAPDPEDGHARISGHIDGVVTGWEPVCDEAALSETTAQWILQMKFPALWENKILNNKNWNKLVKDGLQKTKPVYYTQMQFYMAYLELDKNPGLFTAENADTCEIYAELVPFDARAAQDGSDRGVRVISAARPEDLPRVSSDPSDFKCAWCDYKERCWKDPKAAPAQAPAFKPSWLSNKQEK